MLKMQQVLMLERPVLKHLMLERQRPVVLEWLVVQSIDLESFFLFDAEEEDGSISVEEEDGHLNNSSA